MMDFVQFTEAACEVAPRQVDECRQIAVGFCLCLTCCTFTILNYITMNHRVRDLHFVVLFIIIWAWKNKVASVPELTLLTMIISFRQGVFILYSIQRNNFYFLFAIAFMFVFQGSILFLLIPQNVVHCRTVLYNYKCV